MAAGKLKRRTAFEVRGIGNDGAGGTNGAFVQQFTRWASYVHIRGGETVIAARLAGTHTQVIRVRNDSQTRAVTNSWRVRDVANDTTWNIRDITPTEDRKWLDLLCQSGVAE